jgi:hypothetical protein
MGRERKGQPIPHRDRMKSGTLARARAKLQADVAAKFGALTAREAAIFNYAYVKGRKLTLSRRQHQFRTMAEVEAA